MDFTAAYRKAYNGCQVTGHGDGRQNEGCRRCADVKLPEKPIETLLLDLEARWEVYVGQVGWGRSHNVDTQYRRRVLTAEPTAAGAVLLIRSWKLLVLPA
jgi:hypothetical protein